MSREGDNLLSLTKRLGVASVVGLIGLAGMTVPATAAPAARTGVAMVGIPAKTLPNVNIKGSPAVWKPTSLSIKPKKFVTCTAKFEVWTITNKTKKTQTVSYSVGSSTKKTKLGKLTAGEVGSICTEGPAKSKQHFYIKGSKSTLTVTLK
jgi:hypothetical protein